MKSICFYFQVHQPFRLRPYKFFEIGKRHNYYDDVQNAWLCRRIADKCYLPANTTFLNIIHKYGQQVRIAYNGNCDGTIRKIHNRGYRFIQTFG